MLKQKVKRISRPVGIVLRDKILRRSNHRKIFLKDPNGVDTVKSSHQKMHTTAVIAASASKIMTITVFSSASVLVEEIFTVSGAPLVWLL